MILLGSGLRNSRLLIGKVKVTTISEREFCLPSSKGKINAKRSQHSLFLHSSIPLPSIFHPSNQPCLLLACHPQTLNLYHYASQSVVTVQFAFPNHLTKQIPLKVCKASFPINMKPQTMILVGIALLHGVDGLKVPEPPGR